MQGIGDLREAEDPSISVNCYGFDEKWGIAADPLHWLLDSPDPVHHGGRTPSELAKARAAAKRDAQTGAGLGLPFAKELVARTGVPIGLVPCAHGGTSMEQWDPAKRDQGGASLYGSMYRRFKAVGRKLRGVPCYQGESDANQTAARLFRERFLAFVAAVRRDFGNPELPFYYVQLGRYVTANENPYWNVVREEQRLCAVQLTHAGMVASIDLPLDDPIHVSTAGHKRLGRRLALLVLRDLFGCRDIWPGLQLADISIVPFRYPCYRLHFVGANGRLCRSTPPMGFSIRSSEGEDLRLIYKLEASSSEPSIDLYLRQARPPDAYLWYGWGLDPHCTVTDELDMALPAFGPVELSQVTLETLVKRAEVSPADPSLAAMLPQVVSLARNDKQRIHPLVQAVVKASPPELRLVRQPFVFALGDLSAWDLYLAQARSASLARRKELARTWTTSAHFPGLSCRFTTKWQVVGPFDNGDDAGLDRPYGPERSSYEDGLGGTVAWQPAEANREGFLDLTACFAVKENAVAYAFAEVQATEELETLLLLGSDDGVALSVNGELVHREHVHRAAAPAQDLFVVRLRRGVNMVLAKVEQAGGIGGFTCTWWTLAPRCAMSNRGRGEGCSCGSRVAISGPLRTHRRLHAVVAAAASRAPPGG
jgi:sialate O-acetylesterase